MTSTFTVVWDIDNTLGNYCAGFQAALRREGHPAGWYDAPANYNFAKAGWFTTLEEFFEYHRRAVVDGLFLDITPTPGAVEAVSALADRGIRQTIATHRVLEGLELLVHDTTHAWLNDHFPDVFDGVHFTADKWTVPGDLYIDDAPAVIADLDARGLPRLVFDAPKYNQHLPGPRANTCADVITYVDTILSQRVQGAA